MKKWTKHRKQSHLFFLVGALVTVLGIFIIHPVFGSFEAHENNYYKLTLNGTEIGNVSSMDGVQDILLEEKSKVAAERSDYCKSRSGDETGAQNIWNLYIKKRIAKKNKSGIEKRNHYL